jgi:putative MATE family efflux protein
MKHRNSGSGRAVLAEGPVGKLLVKLTIPMIFGILSMVVFNLTDTFFVGRLGKEQLAAISFTFPVVLVVGSLAQGIGMGASAAISRAIGADDYRLVRRLATDSLILALILVGFFVLVGMATIDPLFRILGAGEEVLPYIKHYMRIWYFGMIFVVVPMVGNSAIRATGDTRTPGIVMMIGALANACMDPLLIFGIGPFPALGIAGAALATVIGRSITFCVALYVLSVREGLLIFKAPEPAEMLESWKEILYIGLPNAGTRMIIPLGAGFVTRIIAGYGVAAVAGFGVATRIEFFSLAAINALSTVIGPFFGQNLGARRLDRVKEGFSKGSYFAAAVGGFFFLLFLFFAEPIAGIFNRNAEVVATTALYLRVVSGGYALQGIYLIAVSGLNVLKQPFHAASLSILEMFLLTVPLTLLGSLLFGIPGIFAALLMSYTLTGLVSRAVFGRALSKIPR